DGKGLERPDECRQKESSNPRQSAHVDRELQMTCRSRCRESSPCPTRRTGGVRVLGSPCYDRPYASRSVMVRGSLAQLRGAPLVGPIRKRAERQNEFPSDRRQQIALAFVPDETRGAQLREPGVEQRRIRVGGGLQHAEGHRITMPQLPQNPQ